MFAEIERVGDAAFAFLIGVGDVLEAEVLAVGQQAQKIAGIFPAGDDHDVGDAGIDQRLDRVVDHRLVVDGQQVFVGDFGEGKEPAAGSAREDDAFHMQQIGYCLHGALQLDRDRGRENEPAVEPPGDSYRRR